ncbi:MAG: HEAT repeat domain-containing protein [Planctomycetota bacterium]|jgi:HEAT repeat protein
MKPWTLMAVLTTACLSVLAQNDAVEEVLRGLQSDDRDEELRAIKRAANQAWARRTVPALVTVWNKAAASEDAELMDAAFDSLTRIGPRRIVLLLDDQHADAAWGVANALAILGAPGARALVGLLDHEDAEVQEMAARRIRWSDVEVALPLLLNAARAKRAQKRAYAMLALGLMPPRTGSAVFPVLAKGVVDEDPFVRRKALEASRYFLEGGQQGGEVLLTGLRKNLRAASPKIRCLAADALTALGPGAAPAAPDLMALLTDRDLRVRFSALVTLRAIGAAAKVEAKAIRDCLRDSSKDVRISAALALAAVAPTDPSVLPALLSVLEYPFTTICDEAVSALHKLGPAARAAIPQLRKLTKKESVITRLYAAKALWRVTGDPKEALPTLLAVLNSVEPVDRLDSPFQLLLAVDILGEMGPAAGQAAPRLRNLMDENAGELRNACQQALKKIAL